MRKITLFLLSLLFSMTAFAEVNSELTGKKISAIGEAVTEIVDGQWYILNNVGRGNYVSEETTIMKMRATSTCIVGNSAAYKAGYLFKITKTSDGEHWNIVSGNGKFFTLGWNSSAISNTAVNYEIGHQNELEAPSVFYLFDKNNNRAADGQDSDGDFVGWSDAIPTGTTGNDAYRLLPVTFEDNIVDLTPLNNAIETVKEQLTEAGYNITLGEAVALQINNADEAGYLSVSHQACDNDVLANAIDNDPATLYHSAWNTDNKNHYMQVDLGEDGKLDAFILSYSTRQSGNNAAPYEMIVAGSNDGEDFTTITKLSKNDVINALPASNGQSYSMFFIADKEYRYLRFTVTSSPNDNNSFGVSSFGIQKATIDGEKSGLHMRYATIFKAINDASSLIALGNDLDQKEQIDATAAALTNIFTTIRVTAYPFETTTDFENPVCYLIKSGRAEQGWKNPYWKYSENCIVINEYDNAKDIINDKNAYWFFVEDDKTGLLTLYSVADHSSSMGYKAVSDGAEKITNNAKDKVGSVYKLDIIDGSGHPYALKPYNYDNYVSNYGGRNNKLGFYNDLNDAGTRFTVIRQDIPNNIFEFNWKTDTEWTNAENYTSVVLNDNKLADGVKYIEAELTADAATKATIAFNYTEGDCALNILGIEAMDTNGNIIAADYHVGKTGTSSTDNVYTINVAEAGTYKVRCYATFDSDNTADKTNGTIIVCYYTATKADFEHEIKFANEYATLYLGYKVAIPAGVEAYVVCSIEDDKAITTQVEGVIPAVTPVILKKVGEDTDYTFAYTENEATKVETNLLKGSIAKYYITEEDYVLNNETAALVTSAVNTNNAFCAYLPKADDMTAENYTLDIAVETETPTAIENVEITNAKEEIFDITGRKVNAITTRGIYIINGKKVIK